VLLTTELKDVDRAIDELLQKKADLETRLGKASVAEKELRTKSALSLHTSPYTRPVQWSAST
jgi:hypothetical protein